MFTSLILFILSLFLLWFGAGMAVNAVVRIAHSLHLKPFFVSFFVLGFFTSITEIMVGVNSIVQHQPEIFVGNLVGSSVVVFLLIIPVLAVLGNNIKLNHSLNFRDLLTATLVVGIPAILTLDNSITTVDALICIVVYVYFVFMQYRNSGSGEVLAGSNLAKPLLLKNLLRVTLAVVIVFSASNLLVQNTVRLGNFIGISPYILSILVLSIGTNIPEITIAIRAVVERKNDVAFGDYLGSASLNTLELGILTLINRKPVVADGSNFSILAFLLGLCLFVYFGKSKSAISKWEGFGLLATYAIFVVCEIITGPGWIF